MSEIHTCSECKASTSPDPEKWGQLANCGFIECTIRKQTLDDKAKLYSPCAPACTHFQK